MAGMKGRAKSGLFRTISHHTTIPFKMEVNVSEEMIYTALEGLMKNDTESIQSATNYLLMAMNNASSLGLFFSMISESYPDNVKHHCAFEK